MSTTPDTDLPVIPTPAPAPTCAACPHPLENHDPIGLRFCAITTSRGMSRGCVCVPT